MRGVSHFALVALMASGSPLPAQTTPPIPEVIADQPPVPDDPLNFGDADKRMTVPVTVAGRGPYNFVVDTGAERTVVSHDLAGLLGLRPGRRVRVTSMTNSAVVNTVIVPSLRLSKTSTGNIEAPALEQRYLGAPGMIGIDALQNHAVTIDFATGQMALSPSKRRQFENATPNEIVVTAKSRYGQLIVTDAHYHSRRIAVVIDTGSPITIANLAFRRWLVTPPQPIGTVMLQSALGQILTADYVQIDRLEIGTAEFKNVPLAFADAQPFHKFDLDNTPALLLGMDALRLFKNVRIDFANREIRFTMPDPRMLASN